MSLPNPKIKQKQNSGFYKTEHDGKVYWAETDRFGNILKLVDPLDLIGISRSADFKIIFIKQTDSPDSFIKTQRWFCQDCHIELRSDVSENIVLKFSSGKFYISDLKELGFTCGIDIENSTDTLILQKSEPYLISAALAKEYLKTTSYGFTKVVQKSGSDNSDLEFYVTV